MLRLRDSRRTSLSAPQQHRNPQPESIARNRYHSCPLPWGDHALAGCLLTPVLFRAAAGDSFFGLDRLAALLLAWVLANLACDLVNASESRFCPSTSSENGSPAPQTVVRVIDRLGVLAAVSATAAFVLNQPTRLVLT